MRICAFSAWPAPTIAFFTAFGAYSATGSPARAGTSMATPRAWPSFSVAAGVAVDEGRLDRRLVRRGTPRAPRPGRRGCAEPFGERRVFVRPDRAGRDEGQTRAEAVDDAPAGAPEARVDADDANRAAHDGRGYASRAHAGEGRATASLRAAADLQPRTAPPCGAGNPSASCRARGGSGRRIRESGGDAVGAKIAEIVAQLAPGGERPRLAPMSRGRAGARSRSVASSSSEA